MLLLGRDAFLPHDSGLGVESFVTLPHVVRRIELLVSEAEVKLNQTRWVELGKTTSRLVRPSGIVVRMPKSCSDRCVCVRINRLIHRHQSVRSPRGRVLGPTAFERMLSLVHLSFGFGAFLVFLLIGPLGSFLYQYSVTFDATGALLGTFGVYPGSSSLLYSVASTAIWYAFLLFVTFSVRYLRLRLAKAEPALISVSPDGEATVHSVFRLVSSTPFQGAIAAVFLVIYLTSIPDLMGVGGFTPLSGSVYIFRSFLRSLVFGSVFGLYGGTLWGLYRFGKMRLRLKSFKEDRLLGVRELGSLSFTFTSVYYAGLALFTAQAVLGGATQGVAVVNLLFMMCLPPLGAVLFMAPLVTTHHRMVEAKEAEVAPIRKLSDALLRQVHESSALGDAQYSKILVIESLERKAASIPTWPFATQMVGKLATIMLSVIAITIARLVQMALGI